MTQDPCQAPAQAPFRGTEGGQEPAFKSSPFTLRHVASGHTGKRGSKDSEKLPRGTKVQDQVVGVKRASGHSGLVHPPEESAGISPVSQMRQVHSLRDLPAASAETQTRLPESDHLSSPPARSVRAEVGRPAPARAQEGLPPRVGDGGRRSRSAPELRPNRCPQQAPLPPPPTDCRPPVCLTSVAAWLLGRLSACAPDSSLSSREGPPLSQPNPPAHHLSLRGHRGPCLPREPIQSLCVPFTPNTRAAQNMAAGSTLTTACQVQRAGVRREAGMA